MRLLLADFDDRRAKAHEEALASRGFALERASHGAAALEIALERVPDVVICPIDLPVIEGERLAEILRGNPRTRHASFVYLVNDDLDVPMAMDPRDGTLTEPWHPEELLDFIDAFAERNARFGDSRPNTEIEGKLTQISLVDLLQVFQMNKRSGTLRVWRSGSGGSGSLLVASGQTIDASVPLADGSSVRGEKALYRLLTWRDGRFEFVPGDLSGEGARIQKPTRSLLLEGMRQMDESEELRQSLPPDDAVLTLRVPREQAPGYDRPVTAEVLDAIEAYRRFGDVIDHTASPDFQVLHVVQELFSRGAVGVEVHAQQPVGSGTRRGALFSPTQLRRLRDWATAQQPRGLIKVLAVGAGGEQLRAFHSALRECADFLTDPRAVRNPTRVEGLTTLGHFTIDESLSMRVIGVPSTVPYAPLLDVAVHGMLGAIVLPKDAFGPGLEATEIAYARLGEPGQRGVYQLIQTGVVEGEVEPAELEGGSVFVLPEGDSERRLGVLRNLFARIVP